MESEGPQAADCTSFPPINASFGKVTYFLKMFHWIDGYRKRMRKSKLQMCFRDHCHHVWRRPYKVQLTHWFVCASLSYRMTCVPIISPPGGSSCKDQIIVEWCLHDKKALNFQYTVRYFDLVLDCKLATYSFSLSTIEFSAFFRYLLKTLLMKTPF